MGARSLIHRFDTLATNIYSYKNHAIYIIKCIYISNNMADSWPSFVNIESMGNIFILEKVDSFVFNGKTCIGLESLGHHVFINLTKYCYILYTA